MKTLVGETPHSLRKNKNNNATVTPLNKRGCSVVVRAREQAPRTVKECVCASFIKKGVPVRTGVVLTEGRGGLFGGWLIVDLKGMHAVSVEVL